MQISKIRQTVDGGMLNVWDCLVIDVESSSARHCVKVVRYWVVIGLYGSFTELVSSDNKFTYF